MRQSKFIRLINLYLDNEISPDELKKLRQELVRSKTSRALFNSYQQLNAAIPHSQLEMACIQKKHWKPYTYAGISLAAMILFTWILTTRESEEMIGAPEIVLHEPQPPLQQVTISSTWAEALANLQARESISNLQQSGHSSPVPYGLEPASYLPTVQTFHQTKSISRAYPTNLKVRQ